MEKEEGGSMSMRENKIEASSESCMFIVLKLTFTCRLEC